MEKVVLAGITVAVTLSSSTYGMADDSNKVGSEEAKHVLLLSIDGMHAADFYNCSHGIAGVKGGGSVLPKYDGFEPNSNQLRGHLIFSAFGLLSGLAALATGGTPRSTGLYYDLAYDRSLDAPATTTGTGLAGGTCTPYAAPTGTTTDNDQGIDLDDTKLNGGAPGAGLTEGGVASIDPKKLSRDPRAGCTPVYSWNFVRKNTIFSVIHRAGGYTAWIDKHPSYSFVVGPGGTGLDDYYSPEVNSAVVALPGVKTAEGVPCSPIRDMTNTSSWTNSFDNIQCYDALKVNALVNEIAGKTHKGVEARIPAVFGMNFQSVYIGESVLEPNVGTGGYKNPAATPSDELLKQIEFVDASIGDIVSALKDRGIYDDTLIIITAKHGDSPIDPTRYVANVPNTPAALLGSSIPFSESPLNSNGIGATEDDVSVFWLKQGASVDAAVALLESNAA